MAVETLSPITMILRTIIPMSPDNRGVLIEQTSPFGKWLNSIQAIFGNQGPQLRAAATLNFPNTAAQSSSELTISVAGARASEARAVTVVSTTNPANSCWTAYVSANDVVTVRFNNYSAGAINPAIGDFSVIVST